MSPINLFVYNRLQFTLQTVESLKKNLYAPESELFIYSDAPKTEKDEQLVSEVRNYINKINGFKSVIIKESQINRGLGNSVTSGVTEIVNEYGRVIVLEDDMELSPYFLKYMNDALNFYDNEEKVISIHGYVYPVKKTLPETFFLRGADCWGWGTWKRGWDLYNNNAQFLLDKIKSGNMQNDFDFNGSYPYTKMLEQEIKRKIDSWAVKWYASAFIQNKLTLYPGRSLVKNIGTTKESTHFSETNVFDVELAEQPVVINDKIIEESNEARKAFEEYFNSIKPALYEKGIQKIKKLFKNS